MKVLVIYSHSYQETSHAGKVILEVFKAQPDFEVRIRGVKRSVHNDTYAQYPLNR